MPMMPFSPPEPILEELITANLDLPDLIDFKYCAANVRFMEEFKIKNLS